MLRLHNERTGQVEAFEPQNNSATIYVCGITPYDTTHLGHAFTYLSFDVLIRYWEYLGYQVKYVENVTDIDDDILRKAREVGDDWKELGNRWTRHFIEDMIALNVRPPDVYPRATDVIPEMHRAIEVLLDKGIAYEAGGNVYFHVAADPHFGEVSHLPEELWLPTANERGNVADDPNKRDPLDFILWQAQKPGEPSWESPWGPGRPGWHIECTAMAQKYLGDVIDVHGGGRDLEFPHHECETAQARGVTGCPVFARFWLHSAMVCYQGAKMSKSLGNLIWARDLLAEHSADAIRALIHAHPYHETWDYVAAELAPADRLAQRLLDAATARGGEGAALASSEHVAAFEAALDDNLDTRAALAALGDLADHIIAGAAIGRDVRQAQSALLRAGGVLGMRFDGDIEPRVREGWARHHRRFE